MRLSLEEAKARFEYDKDGYLISKIPEHRKIKGQRMHTFLNTGGYKMISLASHGKGHIEREHRIIFLLVHGYVPKFIDHVNRDKLDNRIENLRAATKHQNCQNVGLRRHNSHGYKGLIKHTKNRWIAQIRSHYLGIFKSKEEAAKAYDKKAKELYGEFASLNFPKE